MRIIATVTNDLSHDQRMRRICTSLTAAGHDVTLVGRELPDSPALEEQPFIQHRIRCRNHAGKAFYSEFNLRLKREIKGVPYDAICAADVDTLVAGAWLARGGRAKLVFDAHEWFHLTPEVVDRPVIRKFWLQVGRRLAPRADLRYTVAPRLAERLSVDYGAPFETVRNLPERRERSAPLPSDEPKVILYQGMLNPGRGLDVAIKAMDKLPGCELWLAGSGPEEGALRGCRDRLQVAERVRFLGFVPPKDLPTLSERAHIGLNLLESHSPSYYYSLANKALDYIQAEVPSVQMDFPEYRNLHDQFGCYILLSELNPEALVQAIQPVLLRAEVYERLRQANRVAAAKLHWEEEEKVLLGLWEQVLRRENRAS